MGSAQLDPLMLEGQEISASIDLKQQVAERLAAHRERRSRGMVAAGAATATKQPATSRPNAIAAAVAERFAHTPSYRAVLAEQAQRAIAHAAREAEKAAADAEVAARNAQAIAHTQQRLIDELELWNAPQAFTAETAEVVDEKPRKSGKWKAAQPVKEVSNAGLTVRLYEDIGHALGSMGSSTNSPVQSLDFEEAMALDEEIAFRQAPVFEPFVIEPTTPLPANLLAFPRQLVAARKVRPRLAEGPLRDEPAPRSPQLRIFEVEAEQVSTTPQTVSVAPEWANIRLDAHTVTEAVVDANSPALMPSIMAPQTAPLSLRVMAATVDGALVVGAFLAFVAVAAKVANGVPTGIPAAATAGGTLAVLYLLYQMLFFSLSGQTPGMRYARIGLCTLTDENPSRSAMRRRILAQLVSICPLGLGVLWALLDDDGLGWHDRISRMYQRAY